MSLPLHISIVSNLPHKEYFILLQKQQRYRTIIVSKLFGKRKVCQLILKLGCRHFPCRVYTLYIVMHFTRTKQENTIFSLIILRGLWVLSQFCLNVLPVFPKFSTCSPIWRKFCSKKWGLNAFHFIVSELFGFSITEDACLLFVD